MPVSAAVVERYYSRGWYASLQPVLTAVSNRVPFALFDPLVAAVVVTLVATWVQAWRHPGGAWPRVGGALSLTVGMVASLYLVFLATWGLNYRREPVWRHVAFDESRVTRTSIESMASRAVAELNRLHPTAHRASWPDGNALVRAMAPAFAAVQGELGLAHAATPGAPKPTVFGPYFRWTSVSGMIDPFFLEVMLTPDALPFERPALLAHEWGHLAGFAHEAEAGFVGWVTAMRAGEQAQYSAWLDLYPRLTAALPTDTRARLDRALAEGPRSDYRAIARRLAKASPRLQRVAWQGYDGFLRANRVAEGVASYDRVVTLVVGTRFGDGWTLGAAGS